MPTFNRTTTLKFPGSQIADITTGIVNGSLVIREILCSDRLAFGDINSNQFQCQLYNCPNLTGKKIQVVQNDNGTNKTLFTGWVDSCKTDDLSGFKTIVAYDYFYKARKKKIKGWWNSFWAGETQSTLGTMWRSLLSYYNIDYINTTLLCDNLVIKKTKKLKKLKTSYLSTFLTQLCEINLCVPNMNREGTLEFKQFTDYALLSANAIDIRGDYTISKSKFEDYVVAPYDKVELYDVNNKLQGSSGSGDNILSIQNNLFLYNQTDTVMTTLAELMLSNMFEISYIPANIVMKVSNLNLHLGDLLQTQKGLCLICENDLTGTLLVDQSIVSNTATERGSVGNSTALGTNPERNLDRVDFVVDTKAEGTVDTFDPNLEGLPGQEGDFYVQQIEGGLIEKYTIDRNSLVYYYSNYPGYNEATELKVMAFQWTKKGYYIALSQSEWEYVFGVPSGGHVGEPLFKITGINVAGTYKFHAKIAYNLRITPTDNYLGFAIASPFFDGAPGGSCPPGSYQNYTNYTVLNISLVEGQFIEYDGQLDVPQAWVDEGYLWFWILKGRMTYGGTNISAGNMTIQELYIYREEDPYDETHEPSSVGSTYVYAEDPNTGQSSWKEVKRISEVDESEDAGGTLNNGLDLSTDGLNKLSLKPNVMRAWVKADPPQTKRNFNQFCVRYTGAPASGVTISYHGASGWNNTSVKRADDGVYTINCGGTRTSGVDYVAYKIDGLTSGKRYYFNFAANIGNGATFGNDNTKGLGVVFNTTGVINTNDWTGDPDTWHEDTLYYSMYRRVQKNYIDFSFTATAATMYMCVVVADITVDVTTTMALTEFVLSESERKYIRNFYLFDVDTNEWLQFRPFGTKDDGSVEGVTHLSELDDVALDDLQDGQILEYDSDSGKWENTDKPDYVQDVKVDNVSVVNQNKVANINTMTGATASIAGAKGLVPAPAIGDNDKFLSGDGTWKTVQGGGGQGNILYGTNEPTSAIGSDGDVYYQYSEEQGSDWTADAEYLVTDAGTVFDVISNDGGTVRHFTKTNNGKAIAVNYVSSSWSGGMLVSQDADACKYSNEGGSVNTVQSTVIDGVTWYSSTAGAWITGARYNTNGVAPDLVCDYSTQPPNSPSIIIPLILTAANERTAAVADSIVAVFFKQDGIWLKDETGGGTQAIEITKAAYDLLPSAEKNDPNKVYYVTDYPTPSGIDLDDIDDVDITTPTDGQVLKYDAANSKWVNGADEGGLFSVVDGMVCITYET